MSRSYIEGIEKDLIDIQTANGCRFQLKVDIPQEFYGLITGAADNDLTRKRLQGETMMNILVPETEPTDSSIIIEGGSNDSVIAAKTEIAPKPDFSGNNFSWKLK